jgi:hypothetical protein
MTQLEVQEILYQTAGAWFDGLGLTIDGVDLGDVMKYDVLRISGKLIERGNGDGRTDEQRTDS